MGVRLYLDDVGIGARTVGVIRPYPVEIIRAPRQPGDVPTSRVADVQILVSRHIIEKRRVRSHVEPVTSRNVYTGPSRDEASGGFIGCT